VDDAGTVWPDLPYGSWRKTAATLQLHPDRGQGEPGSFLLGQLRSRGDPFFRADRPAPPRRRTRLARCGYARSLFAPGAHFDGAVGEFILPYDTVRSAASLILYCSIFCLRPMQPQRRLAAGTGRRWNVPSVFRGRCVGCSALRVPAQPDAGGGPRCHAMQLASNATFAEFAIDTSL
jgi:hypothetical protein